MKIGMKGALVKTGKYMQGDELKIFPEPTLIGEDFSQVVAKILNAMKT